MTELTLHGRHHRYAILAGFSNGSGLHDLTTTLLGTHGVIKNSVYKVPYNIGPNVIDIGFNLNPSVNALDEIENRMTGKAVYPGKYTGGVDLVSVSTFQTIAHNAAGHNVNNLTSSSRGFIGGSH